MKHLSYCSFASQYQISKQAQLSVQFHIQAGHHCDFLSLHILLQLAEALAIHSVVRRDVVPNSTINQTVVLLFGMK